MAQLVARLVRIEEARGSNPLSSTHTWTSGCSPGSVVCGVCFGGDSGGGHPWDDRRLPSAPHTYGPRVVPRGSLCVVFVLVGIREEVIFGMTDGSPQQLKSCCGQQAQQCWDGLLAQVAFVCGNHGGRHPTRAANFCWLIPLFRRASCNSPAEVETEENDCVNTAKTRTEFRAVSVLSAPSVRCARFAPSARSAPSVRCRSGPGGCAALVDDRFT